jgi:alkylhydroperoxidase/carboxymuconolactone decarboxylase family protein YurZ
VTNNPLEILQNVAPDLFDEVERDRSQTFADGALPKKTKYLIALALDANHGAIHGVTSLAKAALAAGATKDEIVEAIRVAYFIGGVGSVYTAARALKDVF